jgi:hypothetical protein
MLTSFFRRSFSTTASPAFMLALWLSASMASGQSPSQPQTGQPQHTTTTKQDAPSDLQIAAEVEILRVHLKSTNQDQRKAAAKRLTKYGPAAQAALPELVAIMLDPEDGANGYARRIIVQIGLPAIGPMIKGYDKAVTPQQRLSLIPWLGELYKQEENVALGAVLLHALRHDPVEDVRCSVMRFVATGAIASDAMQILLSILEDKKASVTLRGHAASNLGRSGAQAKRAMPTQLRIFQDESNDGDLRRHAFVGLSLIGNDDLEIAKMAHAIVIDEKRPLDLRSCAAAALGRMKHGQIAADDLGKMLERIGPEANNSLFFCSLQSIANLRPNKSAIPVLTEILEYYDGLGPMSRQALKALGNLGVESAVVGPRILDVIKKQDRLMLLREEIIFSLPRIIGAERTLAELDEYTRESDTERLHFDAIAARIKAKTK